MNFKAFQGRFAGLVTLGKTVGILFIVMNLASAFVLERYRIARTAIEVEKLERDVGQLRQCRAYLQSRVSNLESLEHLGAAASSQHSLGLPRPEQIVWLEDSNLVLPGEASVFSRAFDRLGILYSNLNVPSIGRSEAVAGGGAAR